MEHLMQGKRTQIKNLNQLAFKRVHGPINQSRMLSIIDLKLVNSCGRDRVWDKHSILYVKLQIGGTYAFFHVRDLQTIPDDRGRMDDICTSIHTCIPYTYTTYGIFTLSLTET